MIAERTSGDVGETVLVSRNVPIGGEKSAPAILKAKDDAKEIQIENEVLSDVSYSIVPLGFHRTCLINSFRR